MQRMKKNIRTIEGLCFDQIELKSHDYVTT